MPRSLPLLAAAVCLLVLAFASPASAAADVLAPPSPDALLFTQSGTHGTLEPTRCKCDGRYILTLRGVDNHTVWFSDRPNRHAGHIATRNFARAWKSFGFAVDAPNAALTARRGGRSHTLVVELSQPRYSAKRRSMRYVARAVPLTTGPLKVNRGRDGFVPGRFGSVSLFIDSVAAPYIDGCLLAPYADCGVGVLRRSHDLSFANVPGINLTGIILTGANLTGANLTGANLTGANLTGANLTDANLRGANLTRANLRGATISFDFYKLGLKFCNTILPNGKASGC